MTKIERDRALAAERLAALGVSMQDLYSASSGPAALERVRFVLVDLLERVQTYELRTEIIGLLMKGRSDPRLLVDQFERIRTQIDESRTEMLPSEVRHFAWTLGAGLAASPSADVFPEVVSLLQDKRLGEARQMLPYAVVGISPRRAEAVSVLLSLIDDPDITSQVLGALAKLKATEAIARVRECVQSRVPLVRRSAVKALKSLERAASGMSPLLDERHRFRKPRRPYTSLSRTSVNLDIGQVEVLLEAVSRAVDDFSEADVGLIASRIADLEHNGEEAFELEVRYGGAPERLIVEAHMSDLDAPAVAFFSGAKVISRIESEIEALPFERA